MEYAKLSARVMIALDLLREQDSSLFQSDVAEWSIAHRLAVYLESLLPGWHIDCEYNRQGTERASPKMSAGARVRPDVIVHKRRSIDKESNLLAVEIKKIGYEDDFGKVREYTAPPRDDRRFQYQYGISVDLISGEVKWFVNGAERSDAD